MSQIRETGTYLDRILARTVETVAQAKERIPAGAMASRARNAQPSPKLTVPSATIGVIAEFKRASPSKGRFPGIVDPVDITRTYIDGGAVAISCLTDEPFFQGTLKDLASVVETASGQIPVLRKDFTIDEYQIDEARVHGAGMILLIAAVLDREQLRGYRQQAESLGMQALVEVHDEAEAERAVASGATLIGINNRDLRSFSTDLSITERIAPQLPEDAIIVGESGIHSVADAERMAAAGVDLLLVGESLIIRPDRSEGVRELSAVRRK